MKVSFWGMYEIHLFHKFEPRSVDHLLWLWFEHVHTKHPAIVGDREIDDLGPCYLCPATVTDDCGVERSVGKMLFPSSVTDRDILEYKEALRKDDDVMRYLPDEITSEDLTIEALDRAMSL